jgi:hypothetical protein
METLYKPTLYDYGIQNEQTDIRAHVAVLAQKLYVFRTAAALRVMRKYPKRFAGQRDVDDGPTARGHIVPVGAIPGLRSLSIHESRLKDFREDMTTTEKGELAVLVVAAFLEAGRFPLWVGGVDEVTEAEMQIQGVDILVRGTWKIQTKCDYRAGGVRGVNRCTGNLFLQIAERNPLKRV